MMANHWLPPALMKRQLASVSPAIRISSIRGLTRPSGCAVSVTVLLDDAEIADALTKPFFMSPPRSADYWAKWLARFPKASIILITAQGGNLKWIRAGADVGRVLTLEIGRNSCCKNELTINPLSHGK